MQTAIVELGHRETSEGIVIDAVAIHPGAGRRPMPRVAVVVDPHNPLPGIEVTWTILAIDILRQVVEYIEARPWDPAAQNSEA